MCKYLEIAGQKYFATRDYEEMMILNFLYNPNKCNLFVKPVGLLIPLGEREFSPYVHQDHGCIEFMGTSFKYLRYDVPCSKTKVYVVEILGTLLNFHVDRIGISQTEKLMAVRS